MNVGGLLIAALAPGLFWLWFFLRYDRYHPAPRRLIALTFFLGVLVTLPIGVVQVIVLKRENLPQLNDLAVVAITMLLVVGPVEEFGKFAVVRAVSYRWARFEEPMDGLVFAAAASLGFATLENFLYAWNFGAAVMVVRGPISTVAHVIFSSFWGYALGARSSDGDRSAPSVLVGLILAAIFHGAFNLLVFIMPLAAIGLLVVGGVWTVRRFRWAQRVSPFRQRRDGPLIQCLGCRELIQLGSRFCMFCGVRALDPQPQLFCPHCRTLNRPIAAYCTSCGDRLLV